MGQLSSKFIICGTAGQACFRSSREKSGNSEEIAQGFERFSDSESRRWILRSGGFCGDFECPPVSKSGRDFFFHIFLLGAPTFRHLMLDSAEALFAVGGMSMPQLKMEKRGGRKG